MALLGILLASVSAGGDALIYSSSACEVVESGWRVVMVFKSCSSSASPGGSREVLREVASDHVRNSFHQGSFSLEYLWSICDLLKTACELQASWEESCRWTELVLRPLVCSRSTNQQNESCLQPVQVPFSCLDRLNQVYIKLTVFGYQPRYNIISLEMLL